MFFWKTPKSYRLTILFVGYTVLVLVALLLSLFIAYFVDNAKGSWVYPDSGLFYLYFIPLSILTGFLTLAGLVASPFLFVLGLLRVPVTEPILLRCGGSWISICIPSPLAGLLAAMFYTVVVAIINHLIVKRRLQREEQETQNSNIKSAKKK